MNKNPVSIQEGLKVARHTENVEAIELQLEGHQRVLVRSKAMPEFAFLVWATYRAGTYSWLGLDLMNDKDKNSAYPIVCACCETQTYGVTVPKKVGKPGGKSYRRWADKLGKVFKCTLEETCKNNGITTVFMRKADSWDYGDIDGIEIAEASAHQNAMMDQYSHKVVMRNTKFISWYTSRGMFDEH